MGTTLSILKKPDSFGMEENKILIFSFFKHTPMKMNVTYKLKLLSVLIAISCIIATPTQAQEESSLLEDEGIFFIAGLSPVVLQTGRFEVNYNFSLFSTWLERPQSPTSTIIFDRFRLTEFNTNVEAYYGFSQTARWDIGLRIRHGLRRVDNAATSSPFKVFDFSEPEGEGTVTGLDETYHGLREVGLRFRAVPIKAVPQLSINTGFSLVPTTDEETERFLNANRNSFDLNIAYYISLNESNSTFYYFLINGTAFGKSSLEDEENDVFLFNTDKWIYNSSASFFILQRLGPVSLFPGISYSINFNDSNFDDKGLVKSFEQILGIVGAQYQVNSNLNFTLSGTFPFRIESYNLFQRPVRETYFLVGLGGRVLF